MATTAKIAKDVKLKALKDKGVPKFGVRHRRPARVAERVAESSHGRPDRPTGQPQGQQDQRGPGGEGHQRKDQALAEPFERVHRVPERPAQAGPERRCRVRHVRLVLAHHQVDGRHGGEAGHGFESGLVPFDLLPDVGDLFAEGKQVGGALGLLLEQLVQHVTVHGPDRPNYCTPGLESAVFFRGFYIT